MSEPATTSTRGFEKLIDLGIALSAEHDHDRLTERILIEAVDLTDADGGTLYLRGEDDTLSFQIVRTHSLNIAMGGTTGVPIPFPALPMYNPETGLPNYNNVATAAALSGEAINIEDAYEAEGYDFSGTKKFDHGTGFRSKSFLTIPLKNYSEEVIGVLQLINAQTKISPKSFRFRSRCSGWSKRWPPRPPSPSTISSSLKRKRS